jgi:serine-type D-Ala-D-Ala carboxypeptidase (penicillin-binding protein 5/6)
MQLGRTHKLRQGKFFSTGSVLVVVALLSSTAWAFSPDEDLSARAALLMDAATGKVLYQKEPDLRLPPASTTKVLTALVALESGRKLTERLKVSKTAPRMPASKLYLRAGQTMTIEDLLYAILLSSANDASVVLAEGIGGSVNGFSQLMNKKARAIGAVNSRFTNPHGLTAPDHYSTVRDLAVIFRYAMRNRIFREIVQTRTGSVNSRSVVKQKVVARRIAVRNHNRLLWSFDGALGGKTGYTYAAQRCFVGSVQRNGVTLIIAILAPETSGGTRGSY